MSNPHFLKNSKNRHFYCGSSRHDIGSGTTIGGTITQQVQAAKGGVVNFFCYPYTFGEEGFPETEFNCFTNMGECRKAQAADRTAAGSCFREPAIFAN
jgi:hypothetical protein